MDMFVILYSSINMFLLVQEGCKYSFVEILDHSIYCISIVKSYGYKNMNSILDELILLYLTE